MDNVRTMYADLPSAVKAYTILCDGYYTIVLNQNLSHEQLMLSYAHEMGHINSNDFESKCPVGILELFSH